MNWRVWKVAWWVDRFRMELTIKLVVEFGSSGPGEEEVVRLTGRTKSCATLTLRRHECMVRRVTPRPMPTWVQL